MSENVENSSVVKRTTKGHILVSSYVTIDDEDADASVKFVKSGEEKLKGKLADELKYDFSPINTKIGLIAEKLGVEFKGGNNKSSNKNSRSVFDNKQPKSNNTSLEDLENELNY